MHAGSERGIGILKLLAILALLAILVAMTIALLNRRPAGGGSLLTPGLPPPYPPTSSTGSFAGMPIVPQGRWSGPIEHVRLTSETYTFRRQTHNPALPDPLVDSANIGVRIRLVIPPGETVEITDADGGQQVPGTDWWSCATDTNGLIEITVYVGARETDVGSRTTLRIVAEELAASGPAGTVAFGAVHETTIRPP